MIHLHELLAYLGQMGVATILISAHEGVIGLQMHEPIHTSDLADSIIMLRYFEARGEVRQAISVVKKRGSRHERTIREFWLGERGIRVGEPLTQFRGVLTGVPVLEGDVNSTTGTRAESAAAHRNPRTFDEDAP